MVRPTTSLHNRPSMTFVVHFSFKPPKWFPVHTRTSTLTSSKNHQFHGRRWKRDTKPASLFSFAYFFYHFCLLTRAAASSRFPPIAPGAWGRPFLRVGAGRARSRKIKLRHYKFKCVNSVTIAFSSELHLPYPS